MTPNRQIRHFWGALRRGDSSGFSLVEMMAVMVVMVSLAAFVLPFTRTTLNAMNLVSDARSLSSATALAKMRAAARFTQARVFVNLSGRSFLVQRWQKTSPIGWVTEGPITSLSPTVSFGFTGLTAPPPNTQPALAQAAPCLDNAGVAVSGTACIVFNSRGVPVDSTNAPTTSGAFYLGDGGATYGITTSAGGQVQLWQASSRNSTWVLR